MTWKAIVGALVIGAALVGCGSDEALDASTPDAVESPTTNPTPDTLTVDTVTAAHSTLEEMAGAPLPDIQIQSLSISPTGNMTADALDPAKPTELNQYVAYADGRTDVRPYDYGGAEKYDALLATLFSADLVDAETIAGAWADSFNRVQGERADMSASGATITRDNRSGEIEIYVVNGPERDRQTVYYDPAGNFLRVG